MIFNEFLDQIPSRGGEGSKRVNTVNQGTLIDYLTSHTLLKEFNGLTKKSPNLPQYLT